MSDPPIKYLSAGDLAARLNVRFTKVERLVRTGRLQPKATLAGVRGFDEQSVVEARQLLDQAATRRR